jgi:putative addiction module killer protein
MDRSGWVQEALRAERTRPRQGNFSSVKGVETGVYESRIDFGPGYRIYFGKEGATIVLLLGGGTKSAKGRTSAQERWIYYKARKAEEICLCH